MLLEVIDNAMIKYPDTKEYIEQMLQEKCKREGIPIDTVSFIFFGKFLEAKTFLQTKHMITFTS